MSGPSHLLCLNSSSVTRRCSVCTSTHGHRSTNAFSKSVCVFLSRPILDSARSVTRTTTPLVSHHLQSHEMMLGVSECARSSTHQHMLNVGLFVLRSVDPELGPFRMRSHHTSCISSTLVTRGDARCVRVRMVIKVPTHSHSRSVCS
jgi:hypothetical protein